MQMSIFNNLMWSKNNHISYNMYCYFTYYKFCL